ncbi:MAG: hypothetical protein K0R72_167 [Clostridia bacterium]|jgi:hypothetical protein|nr:hypothetical protein [Clostridia bacterium]
MKHEWKKSEKQFYLPKEQPTLVTLPKQKFITITGSGNPNSEEFAEKVGILYSLAYAVKMMPKQGYTPEGYIDYTVYPLEGLWDLTQEGRKSTVFNKNELVYKIMIRQPDFVTLDVFNRAIDKVKKKNNNPLLDIAEFETIEDGLSVQMLHIGSYDNEPASFQKMKDFIKENNLKIKTLRHREIYISDARKTEPSKLKTILRYTVEQ